MSDIVGLKDCDMHTVVMSPKITITRLKANQGVRVFPGGTTSDGDLNILPGDTLTFPLANLHHPSSTSQLAVDLPVPDNGIPQPPLLAPPG